MGRRTGSADGVGAARRRFGQITEVSFTARTDLETPDRTPGVRSARSETLLDHSRLCTGFEFHESAPLEQQSRAQITHLVAADCSRLPARLRRCYSKVASHRGKKTAIVALAGKLLAIACGLP